MEVGLGPGNFVLDGDPAPFAQKEGGARPNFSAHVYCGKTAGWIKMALGMEVGFGPGHIVLDGDPARSPLPKRNQSPVTIFGPFLLWPNGWMDQNATWYMEVGLGLGDIIVLDADPAPPKRTQPPNFPQ